MMNEIKSPEDFKILEDLLAGRFGMSDEDVGRVMRRNAERWIKNAL